MAEQIQVGVPRAGFYKARLINSGMWVAVRFWYGQPVIDGEVQDRFERWCVEVNGKTCRFDSEVGHRVPLDALERWPWCAGHPISEAEYRFMLRRKGWAEEHAPEHPAARPYEPIDLRKLKPVEPWMERKTYFAVLLRLSDHQVGYIVDAYPEERAPCIDEHHETIVGEYATAADAWAALSLAMAPAAGRLQ